MMSIISRSRNIFMLAFAMSTGMILAGCTGSGGVSRSGIQPRIIDPSESSIAVGMGVESENLIMVTDRMARSILDTPEIASAANPPVIALYPVQNDTRFRIKADIFTDRIKVLLNSKCRGRVRFTSRNIAGAAGVAGTAHDEITRTIQREKMLKDEGMVSGGKDRQIAGADFLLTGKLSGISTSSSQGISDYILYTFKLVDAETALEIWEDFVEIKKEGLDDAIYR